MMSVVFEKSLLKHRETSTENTATCCIDIWPHGCDYICHHANHNLNELTIIRDPWECEVTAWKAHIGMNTTLLKWDTEVNDIISAIFLIDQPETLQTFQFIFLWLTQKQMQRMCMKLYNVIIHASIRRFRLYWKREWKCVPQTEAYGTNFWSLSIHRYWISFILLWEVNVTWAFRRLVSSTDRLQKQQHQSSKIKLVCAIDNTSINGKSDEIEASYKRTWV